jgi:hypothetical protein
MSRYHHEPITLKSGKPTRRLSVYPNVADRDDDTIILTEAGDRLDTLSTLFYGTPTYWWVIASVNNLHNAYLSLPEGMTLKIPSDPQNITVL